MDKINERIGYYNKTLKVKQNLVKKYHDKRNKLEELKNNEYTDMLVLEAEINQIEEFMEDLKYIQGVQHG